MRNKEFGERPEVHISSEQKKAQNVQAFIPPFVNEIPDIK
jgi:hypothetical protein